MLPSSSSTAPSPGGAYHPLTQVPLDSPTSVLSSSSDDGDLDEKQLMTSSNKLPWRPLRSRLRAVGRLWRVLLAVASFSILHALLPLDRRAQVSEQLANLSNALPALPEHGSFLHPWRLVKVDDPLISLLEARLESTPPLAPYRFLLGTVQRSEGPALIEWVLHHLALGADHLVVFDSSAASSPTSPSLDIAAAAETRDLILPLVELGWVTLVRVDGPAAAAHQGAANKFRREWAEPRATWSAFLDVNEYLVRRDDPLDPAATEVPRGAEPSPPSSSSSSSSPALSLPDLVEREYGAAVDGVELPRVWMTACPHAPTSPLAGILERHTALVTLEAHDAALAPRVLARSRSRASSASSSSSAPSQRAAEPVIVALSDHEQHVPPPLVAERYPLHVRRFVRRGRECPHSGGQPASPAAQATVGDPALAALDRRACETGGVRGVEEDLALLERGTSLAALGARLEKRWPVFRSDDYSLSVLPSSSSSSPSSGSLGSSRRAPLPSDDEAPLEPGTTLVVDSKHGGHPGFLEVILSTSESRRALPVTYLASGGAAFDLPPSTSRELVFASRARANTTLTVVRQYAALPSPERDPPSPCSIMGHLKNQPNRTQLLRLAEGACRGVDAAQVGTLASLTWPHAKYRGDVVLSRSIRLGASAHWAEPAAPHPPLKLARRRAIDLVAAREEAPVAAAANAVAPAPSDLGLAGLTQGHWALHSLQSLVASSRAERDPQTRLYTTETCPRQFSKPYWDEQCGTHRSKLARDGVWRWVPDGARSYKGAALPASELRACLRADGLGRQASAAAAAAVGDERRRILVVGDSVSSHTFLALQCLVATHLGISDSARHVRFRSVQYEALDLAGATTGPGSGPEGEGAAASLLGRREWDELVAWEWDVDERRATMYPHVVVLNVGLWPASWATASGYAAGLATALEHLVALAYDPKRNPMGPRILWRETTSVFPTKVADPLFQVNPRVRLLNVLADRALAAAAAGERAPSSAAAIEVLKGVYDMVSARADSARDSAHLCPVVQGDVAEVVMHRICRGGLLER
ncbi:hypothetical protein JCM3775_004148 [Rhodotorula graminis]